MDLGGHIAREDHVFGQVFDSEPIGEDDFGAFLYGLQKPEGGGQAEEEQEHRKIAVELNQSQSPEYHFDEVGQHLSN